MKKRSKSSSRLFLYFLLAALAALLAMWTTILTRSVDLSDPARAFLSSAPARTVTATTPHLSLPRLTLQNMAKSHSSSLHRSSQANLHQSELSKPKSRIFETAPFCPGCNHAMIGKRSCCGAEIVGYLQKKRRKFKQGQQMNDTHLTMEAVEYVARKFPQECGFCRPPCGASSSDTGVYTTFDQAAPTIHKARTHYLTTVPEKFRMRQQQTDSAASSSSAHKINLTDYVFDPANQFPNRLHLFEFNPSIVQLPETYQNGIEFSDAIYLASYRVSTENACFRHREQIYGGGSWTVVDKDLPQNNFLGLALLNHNMDILAEGVFSFQKFDARHGCWFGDCANKALQETSKIIQVVLPPLQDSIQTNPQHNDYRLFRLRDQIYVAIQFYLIPLYLSMTNETERIAGYDPAHAANSNSAPFALPQPFPGTAHFQAWMRGMASCAIHGRDYLGSKNLQYFVDSSTNQTVVDLFPDSYPRDIREIHTDVKCGSLPVPDAPSDKDSQKIPLSPSFGTQDELQFPTRKSLFTSDRGSACCVDIPHPETGEHFFLGISHPKTQYPGNHLPEGVVPNSYFSRFFAMQKHSPYEHVAKTGKFCLGYAQASDKSTHPFWNMQDHTETNNPLQWVEGTLDCPRLHFVGSLIDKAGDPSKVIIAYGVGDCLSRFVEMDKSEIAQLLWNPVGKDDQLIAAK